jgi:hypothetical protein
MQLDDKWPAHTRHKKNVSAPHHRAAHSSVRVEIEFQQKFEIEKVPFSGPGFTHLVSMLPFASAQPLRGCVDWALGDVHGSLLCPSDKKTST